ncbi:MAG: ComEC/Rec2 family competence protein, partial [Pirellulaceae bacterium]
MQVGMSAVVPPRQPLVPLAGAAIAGAVCDRVGDVPPVVWWSAVCVACLAWCGYAATCRTDFGGTAILLAAAGSMAGLYHHAHWHFYDFAEVGLYARDVAEPACLVVVVQGSPRHFPSPPPDPLTTMPLADRWEMAVAVEQLRQGRAWQRVSGQGTIVFEGVPPPLRPGDRLRARGMLVAARPPLNPGESDARLYDRAVRRLVRLVVAGGHAVEVLERGSRWTGAWWLDAARQRGVALLRQYVDARQAGLAAAVLLGSREQVDADVNQDFLTTGTSHLLSISGLHVGILAYGLWAAGRSGWFHRRLALWGAMGFVTAYAALTFAEPPVVRAAVLISVICLARLCGRQALSFNTLAVAGLIVFAQNPAAIFQAGTQLSFLAVA